MSSIRSLLVATAIHAVHAATKVESCGGLFNVTATSVKDGSLRANAYFSLNITFANNYKPIHNPLVMYHLHINNHRYLPQIDTLCLNPSCMIGTGNTSILLHNNIPKQAENGTMRIELHSPRMEKLACLQFTIRAESIISKLLREKIGANLTEVVAPADTQGLLEPRIRPPPSASNLVNTRGFLEKMRGITSKGRNH